MFGHETGTRARLLALSDCIVIEKVLTEMRKSIKDNGNKLDKILRNGISRPSGKTQDIKDEPQVVVDLAKGVEPSIVIESLKEIVYEENYPKLTDMITTRDKKVILKASSPADAERVGEELKRANGLGDKVSIRVSKFRKHRLMVFGVPESADEEGLLTC